MAWPIVAMVVSMLVFGLTARLGDQAKMLGEIFKTDESVRINVANPARLFDNATWTAPVSYLDFLREIGKHFSVNVMVSKESVRARMEDREAGISYTEFSYMLLQALDFYVLARDYNCELQIGGTDQWGKVLRSAKIAVTKSTGAALR